MPALRCHAGLLSHLHAIALGRVVLTDPASAQRVGLRIRRGACLRVTARLAGGDHLQTGVPSTSGTSLTNTMRSVGPV